MTQSLLLPTECLKTEAPYILSLKAVQLPEKQLFQVLARYVTSCTGPWGEAPNCGSPLHLLSILPPFPTPLTAPHSKPPSILAQTSPPFLGPSALQLCPRQTAIWWTLTSSLIPMHLGFLTHSLLPPTLLGFFLSPWLSQGKSLWGSQ